jgi:hypothetical protein
MGLNVKAHGNALKPGKMAPKPVFIGEIHTKFAKNDF